MKRFLIVDIVAAILIIILTIATYIAIPTKYMEDSDALAYILELEQQDRYDYIDNVPDSEKERLYDLWLSYIVAEAEAEDTFDFSDTEIDTE